MRKISFGVYYIFVLIIIAVLSYCSYLLYKETNLSRPVLIIGELYLLNLIFTVVIFLQHRHAKAKLSWITAIIIMPFFGHLLFMIFGSRYWNRMRISEYKKRETFKNEKFEDIDEDLNRYSNIIGRGIYKGDIDFYDNGIKSYKNMFEEMKNAKKFIHVHYYIIKPGEIFDEFKSIILKKVSEGVEVRLIIDDFGRWAIPWYETRDLIRQGIQVKVFGKVYFPFINSENGFRTHRKMVLIDGQVVFVGGQNIGDEYASLDKRYGIWLDLQAKITGKAVRSYTLLFNEDWYQMTGEKLSDNYLKEINGGKNKLILFEDSPEIEDHPLQLAIVSLINNAKNEIILTTPYFIPTNNIVTALKNAALSGVKIKIFTPGIPDKKLAFQASRYYIHELRGYGINFYETSEIFLHSKFGIFDRKIAYFGTANIDYRSLYSQFEFVSIFKGESVKKIIAISKKYENISNKITDDTYKLSRFKKSLRRFYVNFFTPLI